MFEEELNEIAEQLRVIALSCVSNLIEYERVNFV
jgi:hypothetical protein